METTDTATIQNLLLLLKFDAKNLLERITKRKKDYLAEFSLKRTRAPFTDIFFSRYKQASMNDLKYCGEEVIVALDQFYQCVDELKWYLDHTQDMVNLIEDKIDGYIRTLKKHYGMLLLYIEAQIEALGEMQNEVHDSSSMELVQTNGSDSFVEQNTTSMTQDSFSTNESEEVDIFSSRENS